MRIRRAHSKRQIRDALSLARRTFKEPYYASSNSRWFVATDAGLTVACVVYDVKTKYMSDFAVRRKWRRRGIGCSLIKYVRKCVPSGLWAHVHNRNVASKKIMRRAGFRISLPDYSGEWDGHVVYRS